MLVIVLVIKSCFFTGADNYNIKQKSHMFYFFNLFLGEIIIVILSILAVVIKDLEIQIDNLNMQLKKSVIKFEVLS